ncbi:uncharacterized protein LOC111329230 isoform X2 [Stylophora pistillata]|uniref:uncharacterized protein LOC111329230 isoform X2 n=1 Tax=Stylophora pistillata TaxID=50429 RepID=UPI000C055B44|nr:uncharacterized protein LOC111329230 isoform X2 [Stylophora pistillata]
MFHNQHFNMIRGVVLFVSIILALRMGRSADRKHSGKYNLGKKSPIFNDGARQNVIKKQSTPNYLTGSDGVPAGMTNVKQPGGSLTAAVGDGKKDDTSVIKAIIKHVEGSTNNKVFFPRGEYLVSGDIAISGSVELHGTQSGVAVIKASTPYAIRIHNASPVRSILLIYLYFDGIRVVFEGDNQGPSSTSNITIESCVFFSSASASQSNGRKRQFEMIELENSGVYKNVFLRDSGAYGVASSFRSTVNVSVIGNVCGLELSKLDWLSSKVEPVSHWRDQKEKLEFLRTRYNLKSDQGYFNSCLYDQCDKRMKIEENIFNGSPNTARHRDHAMYLKGFDSMNVTGNYVRGWPADASGGIKARNGKNLWLARNYVDDTGILLYSHENKKNKTCLHNGLKNVVIYGNHFVQRTRPGRRDSSLSYYEPHFVGDDENIKYSANVFQILGSSCPTQFTCIWLTNGNASQHHVYRDNVYYGTPTPVKLQVRRGTPSYEENDIDQEIKNLYNYSAYKLDIPPY